MFLSVLENSFEVPLRYFRLPEPVFEPSPEGLAKLLDMSFTRVEATK